MQNSLKNKKPTVTIGIPALNEENTIVGLLNSVIAQKQIGYFLEKIIVITDGSSDSTSELVQLFAKKHTKITLIKRKSRLGKCANLNLLYKRNQSDILVTLDADIYLTDPLTIAKMIGKFTADDIVLVSASDAPVAARTFAQKVINTWYGLWHTISSDFKKGNNIYNVHGNASALRREFARTVRYPKNITADQDFLYLSVINQQKRYIFAKDSIVLFNTPETVAEFSFQTSRFLNEKTAVFPQFGKWVQKEYSIPLLYKLKKIALFTAEHPLSFTLAAFLYLYTLIIYKKRDPLNKIGLWQQVVSTKRPITFTTA